MTWLSWLRPNARRAWGRGSPPDSDLDFLVVLDRVDPAARARLMGRIRFAIEANAPIDVFVTDVEEFDRRKDVNGSMLYWPAREGQVVYERDAA